jgi:hypothetical protein
MIFFLAACAKPAVEKPDNLIEEGKMVDIMYDLSLLESIKSQKPTAFETYHINPNTYIYKKYKIDSLQFAKSSRYYATDLEKYKAMYDKVAKKIEARKISVDSVIVKKGGKAPTTNSDTPQVQ